MQGSLVFVVALAFALATAPAGAQEPGSLDSTFDGDGKVVTQFGTSADEAHAVALQPDGRFVAVGFTETGSGRRFAAARYLPDGSLDPSFGGDGRVTLPQIGAGLRDEAYAVAIQPDGRIVMAGETWGADNQPHWAVARLENDGSLDPSFDGDGVVTTVFGAKAAFRGVALQADGKIVASGYTAGDTGSGGFSSLVRYNPDGTLDAGFNDRECCGFSTPPGIVVSLVGSSSVFFAVAIRADGGIVATGRTLAGNFEVLVVRYLSSGLPDGSFGPVGTTAAGVVITSFGTGVDSATSLELLDDGRVVIAGFAFVSGFKFALARYLPSGALDGSFDGDGLVVTAIGALSQAFGIRLDPLGRAVVAGEGAAGSDRNFALARYLADGTLDPAFGSGGFVTTPFGSGIDSGRGLALQPDGRIVVAGITDGGVCCSNDWALARYHGDAPPPPPDRLLTVATVVTADASGGTVTSAPAGIDCGADCEEAYADGTEVTLTASSAEGSRFTGWSGDCGGTATCVVTLDADRSVTATFDDLPAPGLVSTTPQSGATDVSVKTAASATFDSVVESFTLTLTSDRGRVVEGVVTCDTPCTSPTFTPSRTLAGRTAYTAVVVATGAGGEATEEWTFTTGRKGGKPG